MGPDQLETVARRGNSGRKKKFWAAAANYFKVTPARSPSRALEHESKYTKPAKMHSDHEEKPHKKSKHKHRRGEEEEVADRMDVDEDETPQALESTKKDKKKKHKDKKRKERPDDVQDDVVDSEAVDAEPTASPEKKHKRHKSEDKAEKKDKKHKKDKKDKEDKKHKKQRASKPSDAPAAAKPDGIQYPFFTQTFSQRIPIWPASFDEPLTKTAREYLEPMLNRYSPKFKGVLLAYRNVNLSDRPQQANPNNPPTDDTPVTLESFECYAPPFAWLTADLHLFVPSRGAWMEGEINLQSEGHIGLVCFDKFNASISRRGLPKGWNWVEQDDVEEFASEQEDPFGGNKQEGGEEEADGEAVDGGKEATHNAHRLRSTGYWVNENGEKVGGKIYFRIKNFSSGSTGDYTFLSLQGTLLDDEAAKEAAQEERMGEKLRRAKQNTSGLLYPTAKVPEFSMTKLKDDTRI